MVVPHHIDTNNKSNIHHKNLPIKEPMFNYDNKENHSINYNEFSPNRILGKNDKINHFLDSDSSISSPKLHADFIAQKLEK